MKEKAGRGAGTVVGTTTTEVIMEGSGAGAGAGAGTATGKEGGTGEEIMATRVGTGTVTAIAATGEERNDGWQGLDRDCQFLYHTRVVFVLQLLLYGFAARSRAAC